MQGVNQAGSPAGMHTLWSLGRALSRLKSKFLSLVLDFSSSGLSLTTPLPVDYSLLVTAPPWPQARSELLCLPHSPFSLLQVFTGHCPLHFVTYYLSKTLFPCQSPAGQLWVAQCLSEHLAPRWLQHRTVIGSRRWPESFMHSFSSLNCPTAVIH